MSEPSIRRSIEDAIERLLSLLDAIDGDVDQEDGADDEPYVAGSYTDREDGDDNGIGDAGRMTEQWSGYMHGHVL